MPSMYNFGAVLPRDEFNGAVWICKAHLFGTTFKWDARLFSGTEFTKPKWADYRPALLDRGEYVRVTDLRLEEIQACLIEGVGIAVQYANEHTPSIEPIIWAYPMFYPDRD